MPKTFPIRLEVEEIALGTVLRKLNEMPGICGLHLDLGQGGQGPGRKQLEEVAKEKRGETQPQKVLKALESGPKTTSELAAMLGGKKTSVYTVIYKLRALGLEESGGKALHQLTKKAKAQLGALPAALPAPGAIRRGPSGRAAPGSSVTALRAVLADGPKSPGEVRKDIEAHGISPKSVSGVLERAKRSGMIKKNGSGYELTAKGQKIEIGEAAHG